MKSTPLSLRELRKVPILGSFLYKVETEVKLYTFFLGK